MVGLMMSSLFYSEEKYASCIYLYRDDGTPGSALTPLCTVCPGQPPQGCCKPEMINRNIFLKTFEEFYKTKRYFNGIGAEMLNLYYKSDLCINKTDIS